MLSGMADVVLFHSVLGIRQGERDAAARLTADGHQVLLPDLLDGRVFDDYEPAMAWSDERGQDELLERASAAVRDVPDGFVVGGFSQGSSLAFSVALRRKVSAVLQFSGINQLEWFGPDALWPTDVPVQAHLMSDDPFREQQVEEQAAVDISASGGRLELFVYPGAGHLFTDPTLPVEYDSAATQLMWSRVLPFVREHGTGSRASLGPTLD